MKSAKIKKIVKEAYGKIVKKGKAAAVTPADLMQKNLPKVSAIQRMN